MEAKELRIGNWVYNDTQEINFQVDGGCIATEELRYKANNLYKGFDAIPLTEEWLLKFGFKQRENEAYEFFEIDSVIGLFYLRPSYLGGYYFGNDVSDELNDQINYEYVHQLQNLYFALTGEELTVK